MLRQRGHRIVSVVSRRTSSAKTLARRLASAKFSDSLASIPPETDLVLITASDDSIPGIAKALSQIHLRFDRVFAAHTSGMLSSEALRPLRRRGAKVFSLHPIQTFPGGIVPKKQIAAMEGISYGFEGPPVTRPFAQRLVRELGGRILPVPKESKILYHLACVFASNYTVAVLGAAEELLKTFGKRLPLNHFEKLVAASVRNALNASASAALTGPVARGSVGTIRQHLRELSKKNRRLLPLYRALGLYALDLAATRSGLTTTQKSTLKRLLHR